MLKNVQQVASVTKEEIVLVVSPNYNLVNKENYVHSVKLDV